MNSFHDQLVATRDRKHSKNHPFFELWAQGKLTREQTAFYCTQHYHFVGEFLNWLAYQGTQIRERDVKNYLFENLGDEENPDDRHLDMLKDYVAASGVDRDSVDSGSVEGAPARGCHRRRCRVRRSPRKPRRALALRVSPRAGVGRNAVARGL